MTTTANSKPAYILLEVIVSIIILSIVGISLLRVNSAEKRLYTMGLTRLDFLKQASIPLNQHSIDLHKKTLNIYDSVKYRYDLKNDFLIKELKKVEISYSQKYKSMVNITQNGNSVNLLIDEIVLKNKKTTTRFLTVRK